jgi:hypothetical protein
MRLVAMDRDEPTRCRNQEGKLNMPAKKKPAVKAEVAKKPVVTKSAVKNTAVPKFAKAAPVITQEMIAKRAFEIHMGGTGGSETDNWHRAERELKAGL